MKKRGWVGEAIDVVRMLDGKLMTLDNTRVLSARYAGIDVWANVHPYAEPLSEGMAERFTTRQGIPDTWGRAVELKIGKQRESYRRPYPSGPYVIGWKGN